MFIMITVRFLVGNELCHVIITDTLRAVGGEILDLCLTRLKKYARVVLCGK